MKTIEEKASLNLQYEKDFLGHDLSEDMVARAYIAGAKEQKAIDDEMRLQKCDDITEAEYNRETAFVDWYLKNGKGTPTFSDAIEWARKDLLDKVCNWLGNYFVFEHEAMSAAHCDAFLRTLRKSMEE